MGMTGNGNSRSPLNFTDNFCLNATLVINDVADLQDQLHLCGSRYCTCTEWGGQFQARSGFFPFCMWSKIIEFLEQGLCASRSHGSHPTCLHLPHSHHHGLRLAQVSSLEEELLGLYQALTSRAFLLRVGFGSGLTKKFGFRARVRVLCILWS